MTSHDQRDKWAGVTGDGQQEGRAWAGVTNHGQGRLTVGSRKSELGRCLGSARCRLGSVMRRISQNLTTSSLSPAQHGRSISHTEAQQESR